MKIGLLKALGTDDIKGSLGDSVINTEFLKRLEQHLAKQAEVKIKATSISPSESFVIVTGPQELEKGVHDLFLVFEVGDISIILGAGAKTVVDPTKRGKERDKLQNEMATWVEGVPAKGATFDEKIVSIENDH